MQSCALTGCAWGPPHNIRTGSLLTQSLLPRRPPTRRLLPHRPIPGSRRRLSGDIPASPARQTGGFRQCGNALFCITFNCLAAGAKKNFRHVIFLFPHVFPLFFEPPLVFLFFNFSFFSKSLPFGHYCVRLCSPKTSPLWALLF